MANSASKHTTQEECTKLQQQMQQGADNAAGYLSSLKNKFTDYDNSHKNSQTATSWFQSAMDRASSSVDQLRKSAEGFRADANSASDSFVKSAQGSVEQARSALEDLGKSAQAYDENLRSSINSNVDTAKQHGSNTLSSWQDSISSLVSSTRDATFNGFEALQQQLAATQQAFTEQAAAAHTAASEAAENIVKKTPDSTETATKGSNTDDGPTLMERATGAVSSSIGYVTSAFQGSDEKTTTDKSKTPAASS